MRRILVTGSRDWTDRAAIRQAIVTYCRARGLHPQEVTIVHGGARGADLIAADIAREYGCFVEEHPADWGLFGKSAGHRRNAEMVNAGADVVLAFPLGESRGTRMCMRMAKAAGLYVLVHDPDKPDLLDELAAVSRDLGLYDQTDGTTP